MDEEHERRLQNVAAILRSLEDELRKYEQAWMAGRIKLPADYFDELAVLKRRDMQAYGQRLSEVLPQLRAQFPGIG